MSGHRPGFRVVRLLARWASLLYPASFRHEHGGAFPAVAVHRFEKESSRRAPLGAVLATSRLLVADTLSAAPAIWMKAIRDKGPVERASPAVLSRVGGQLRGTGHDLKLALRAASRRPAFSGLVIATLGLGLGASTAAFDALDRSILNPLPFERSEELVVLTMRDAREETMTSVPLPLLQDWRVRATTVKQLEVFRRLTAVRTTASGADVLDALGMSGALGLCC